MKIDMNSNLPVYRRTGGQVSARKAASGADRSAKTDVAEFSRGQSTAPDKSLASLKANLLYDVAAATSKDRISELKEQVKAGTYNVPTEDLVNVLLD